MTTQRHFLHHGMERGKDLVGLITTVVCKKPGSELDDIRSFNLLKTHLPVIGFHNSSAVIIGLLGVPRTWIAPVADFLHAHSQPFIHGLVEGPDLAVSEALPLAGLDAFHTRTILLPG